MLLSRFNCIVLNKNYQLYNSLNKDFKHNSAPSYKIKYENLRKSDEQIACAYRLPVWNPIKDFLIKLCGQSRSFEKGWAGMTGELYVFKLQSRKTSCDVQIRVHWVMGNFLLRSVHNNRNINPWQAVVVPVVCPSQRLL